MKKIFIVVIVFSAVFSKNSIAQVVQNGNSAGHLLYGDNSASTGGYLFINANTPGTNYNSGAVTILAGDGGSGSLGSSASFEVLKYNAAAYSPLLSIHKDGRMGIGTTPPSSNTDRMTVNGDIALWRPTDNLGDFRLIKGSLENGSLGLFANQGPSDGSYIMMHGRTSNGNAKIELVGYTDHLSNFSENMIAFIEHNTTNNDWNTHMVVKKNGKVIIGTEIQNNNNNDNYKLFVEKGILTEKLKVANRTDYINWSDFVFDDDYQLMPLKDLETYIEKNNHLPEIPTAEDVTNNGVDIVDMEAKLLQKVEELTLYVIQLQKEVDELKVSQNTK